MCGIAGKLIFRPGDFVSRRSIERMCSVLSHRGPDDEGIFLDRNFGMGMRRLSIIDLHTGRQPIGNEDGSVWTVFNGEIYNFSELRNEMERLGHRFRTSTDTEVIVHLYEEYGDEFPRRLAGMFAIALWDKKERRLLLVRDRLGIKPLFYSVDLGRVLFGSELKAILQEDDRADIDLQALHDYLSLNYVPGPRTILKKIKKVNPGHMLVCSRGAVTAKPYWELDWPAHGPRGGRTEESYCEELRALLKEVLRQHLISDVPVGVFLSGGVDSSALVALMSEVSSRAIRTFSVGFEEGSYDELSYARLVAAKFHTRHRELVLRPDAVDLLPKLIRHFDEPFGDSSAIPVFCLSSLARNQVKVALSGEGSDEVFAGYETYAACRAAQIYRRLPGLLSKRVIPAIVRRLPVSHRKVSFEYKAKRFVQAALLPPLEAHYGWKVLFTEDAKAALYTDGLDGFGDPLRLYRAAHDGCAAPDVLSKLQHVDLKVYLPDDILVKADRMSMAASLELRVPFLDHRVVEFAASLPPGLKLRRLTKKYILRRALAPLLPAKILRSRKRGFNVPIPIWLRGELRPMISEVLSPKRLQDTGIFNPEPVTELMREHWAKRADHSRSLWALLVFMLWHHEFTRRPTGASGAMRERSCDAEGTS